MDMAAGDIRAVEFTSSRVGDSLVLPDLPDQIPDDEQIGTLIGESQAGTPSVRAPLATPSAPAGATRQSSRAEAKRSSRSAGTTVSGRRAVLLRPLGTTSSASPGA